MTDQETRDALIRLASGQWLSSRERQLVIRAMESERERADELAAKLEAVRKWHESSPEWPHGLGTILDATIDRLAPKPPEGT